MRLNCFPIQSWLRAAPAAALWLVLASPASATMPTRSGTVPPGVAQAFQDGLFNVPAPSGLPVSVAQTTWKIPVVLVSFSDSALTHTAAEFDLGLFDSTHATPTGSVFDYYRWVSGGRLLLTGRVVATVHLPHTRYYYSFGNWGLTRIGSPNNSYGAVYQALTMCDSLVNWNEFDLDHDGFVDMLWLVHAGEGGETSFDDNDLWSITSRMSVGWSNAAAFVSDDTIPGSPKQKVRLDRFSILPELSGIVPHARAEIGVFCHEFGHALGLPDLYDTSALGGAANVGPGNWSLMSTGGFGGDGFSPQYPTHVGAWPALYLGWIDSARPVQDSLVTMGPLAQGATLAEFWFQGEQNPEHFLIENRQRQGFDRNLPASGMIVYHLDDAAIGQRLESNTVNVVGFGRTPGLSLVEANGREDLLLGTNRGDAGDPFPGTGGRTGIDDDTDPNTRTFSGAITNIALENIRLAGDSVRFLARVRAPGWLPAEDHTDALYQPVSSYGPATRAVVDVDGTVYAVLSELRAGLPQVVLRLKRRGLVWEEPQTLSASSGSAVDPTLALLPGGDLVVAWSDRRGGTGRIYYRARIRGTWTPEQSVSDLAGDARSPALGVDPRGMVHLAWLNVETDRQRVMFMRFLYFAPFGQPAAASESTDLPTAPALASAPDGGCFLIWSDRASSPQTLWFAHYSPDSGLGKRQRLTPTTAYSQPYASAVVDSSGTLHSVWEVSGPGVYEIHYQRRTRTGVPSPRDTVVEAQGSEVLNPSLSIDRQGTLHLVLETLVGTTSEVRYKRWQAGRGWDFRSTQVTQATEGGATGPTVLPISPGNLTVLYTGYPSDAPRFMERRRQLDGAPVIAAPLPAAPPRATFALGPNPLRPGQALEARWTVPDLSSPGAVEFFDLGGRRVAVAPFEDRGGTWSARLEASETARWSSGIYFARVRGVTGPALRLVILR